jgi:hypothetical protein
VAYIRVLPRDLFNEADLLKCYGQLWILLDGNDSAGFVEEEVSHFDIVQNPADGSLTVQNLTFAIGGKPYNLSRPLNTREKWSLYAERDDEVISVFDDHGNLSDEMEALL